MRRFSWESVFPSVCFVGIVASIAIAFRPFGLSGLLSSVTALLGSVLVIVIARRIGRAAFGSILGATLGILVGLILGLLFVTYLHQASSIHATTAQFFEIAVPVAGAYVGYLVGVAKAGSLNLSRLGFMREDGGGSAGDKILDTSVLIDGRIAEIGESGFVEGRMVIPHFVLHELQLVADSSDSSRRNRGRRGLDVVQRMQNMPGIKIHLSAKDFPDIREVDLKLIELAKRERSTIVTTDFNLNKLAQVQGVRVLNINELANGLRPVVLPGESMRVFILKEGKEHAQGVAYLDDGTMVVVDNARRFISKTIEITVTSVLQTTAGKMIFGRYDERTHAAAEGRPVAMPHTSQVTTQSGSSASAAGAGGS